MKKILMLLAIFSLSLSLMACKGEEKEVSVVESDVLDMFLEYTDSLKGQIEIVTASNETSVSTTLKYEYSEEGDLVALICVQGNKAVYVKDKVAYMKEDSKQTKTTLTANDEAALVNKWGFSNLVVSLEDVLDTDFFSALTFENSKKGLYTYLLDFTKYEGAMINIDNKSEVKFNVFYQEEVLRTIELVVVKEDVTSSVALKFNGLDNISFDYPTDLSAYQEADYE